MATQRLFLKLGGSLITDKTAVEVVRETVLARVAMEIAQAQAHKPDLQLVIGHGSGSFGHVAAAKYGTRQGVQGAEQWHGFAEVSDAAARLNRRVTAVLLKAGLPVISLQPSASALCEDGRITHIASGPIAQALKKGLMPIIYGDVAFDSIRGGTIISTEEVMMALATVLPPTWLLLAGETEGVYDEQKHIIPQISQSNFADIQAALGGSRGTDVTGGMATKVRSMLNLVTLHPHLSIRIFSGLEPDNLYRILQQPETAVGTLIH